MPQINSFAPVIIPTLNRYDHLKRCLGSLSRCTYADRTEVIVSLDFPPDDKYRQGYEQISDYLDNFNGFLKLTVIKQERNLGVVGNYKFLLEYVSRFYDKFISTEDDNEFSPCFLEFMNIALDKFKNEPSIMSVGGYTAMPYYGVSSKRMILTFDFSAWGYGTWVNKQEAYFLPGITYYHDIAMSFKSSFKIFRTYPALLSMLLSMLLAEAFWGDTMCSTYNIVNDVYQLKPTISMVRNLGQDGSGAHSGIDETYLAQEIHEGIHFDINDIALSNSYKEISKVNKRSFWMGLSKNRIRAIYSILGIIYRWVRYQIIHPNYK